jgi:hypothetical protein
MPIEGRGRHLDPKQIPTRDRDIHLVKIKFCSDINPQQTVEKAHNQHQPLIQRIWTKSLQGISWNSKVTLQCYTSWSWGHNLQSVRYTIIPLLNLGVPTHKVHQLATKLHCHTIKSLNKIIKTRHKIHLNNNNSDNGGSGRGALVEQLASGGLGAGRIHGWQPGRRILISLCCFSFSFFGGALASVGTSYEPFLNACWWLPV